MQGQCLCAAIAFEISLPRLDLYRCHCSLCRKQSGAQSNCAAVVAGDAFHWLRGESQIASWTRPSGYRTDFCTTCGAPVPNLLRNSSAYWVPAGLLDDDSTCRVVMDIHLASAALWEDPNIPPQRYPEAPTAEEFFARLHSS